MYVRGMITKQTKGGTYKSTSSLLELQACEISKVKVTRL